MKKQIQELQTQIMIQEIQITELLSENQQLREQINYDPTMP